AQVLINGFLAVNSEDSFAEYLRSAADRNLALAATPESVAALVAVLDAHAEELGQAALLLAGGIERHASTLNDLGRNRLALSLYDAIRPVFENHAPPEMVSLYYTDRAIVLSQLGQLREAVGEDDRVIAIYTRLVEQEGRTELANDLAAALMNKAIALTNLGQLREAVGEYDRAIAIRTRLVEQEGRAELANDLAAALMNKAVALKGLGQLREAV